MARRFSFRPLAALAWLALRLLRAWVNEQTAPVWLGLATRQMAARPGLVMLQVSAMAMGWMALILLVLLRTDLLSAWRTATPSDAPNRFVIFDSPPALAASPATPRGSGPALRANRRTPIGGRGHGGRCSSFAEAFAFASAPPVRTAASVRPSRGPRSAPAALRNSRWPPRPPDHR